MSEAIWQQQFVQLAGYLGWRWMHVRRSLGRGEAGREAGAGR